MSEQRGPAEWRRRAAGTAFSALAAGSVATAVVLTWFRLFVGMDLQDESFYVLVPWRWALGDRPFVDGVGLGQIPALIPYPFVKLFAIVRAYDVTGLVLYTRHLYLLMMIGVALAAFMLLRRLLRWQLALIVSSLFVTYIFWATPQLSYNTLSIAFLTLGFTLGAWVVVAERGRRYALASGAAFGAAVVAYPSLLFVMPFFAVFFLFAQGRRAVAMIAEGAFAHPPDPGGHSTGRPAFRALCAWVFGGALVLFPTGLVLLSFGLSNLVHSWRLTMAGARQLHQLGGASKALTVAQGFWRFLTWRPYILLAAILVYWVYRRWPRVGRALLTSLPVVFWLAAQRPLLWASGYVQAFALLAPYLYLFIPKERREAGARLLIWIWLPATIAGAMTAYTSAAGYVNSAVGLAPTLMVGGVFLAWALEAVSARSSLDGAARLPWLALVTLVAVVGVTIGFQFQFQQRDVPYRELTSRFSSGPWSGIKVSPDRRRLLDGYAADLRAQARPGDQLLVFNEACGYYLYWKGSIASNTYWMGVTASGQLPQWVISYYRRHRIVPTLVVHLLPTAGMTEAELQAACGGLDYPPVLVRPKYAFQRKPADESTAEVLARLPRE